MMGLANSAINEMLTRNMRRGFHRRQLESAAYAHHTPLATGRSAVRAPSRESSSRGFHVSGFSR
eukprot:847771-Rhodomonas_salina.3